VNAARGSFPRFYIFKDERIRHDYIKHSKSRTCMVMQTKTWMTTFLFKEFLSFLKRTIPRGIFPSNQHLLVLNMHGSHVRLEAIELTQQFQLNMVT
jgi:hypothetical protein